MPDQQVAPTHHLAPHTAPLPPCAHQPVLRYCCRANVCAYPPPPCPLAGGPGCRGPVLYPPWTTAGVNQHHQPAAAADAPGDPQRAPADRQHQHRTKRHKRGTTRPPEGTRRPRSGAKDLQHRGSRSSRQDASKSKHKQARRSTKHKSRRRKHDKSNLRHVADGRPHLEPAEGSTQQQQQQQDPESAVGPPDVSFGFDIASLPPAANLLVSVWDTSVCVSMCHHRSLTHL